MNRLFLIRHGGSTGNEDASFYDYNDSALCLTTNGIRQALNTGDVLKGLDPTWRKPGNFNLEVYASEYFRTHQTARIVLDQMGLLSTTPTISPFLNERNYGTTYDPRMDTDADYDGYDSESGARTRQRVKGFLASMEPLLERADVFFFSHFGAMRAMIAELLGLTNAAMMSLDVPNGRAFQFVRSVDGDGRSSFAEQEMPDHVLEKTAPPITPLPAK